MAFSGLEITNTLTQLSWRLLLSFLYFFKIEWERQGEFFCLLVYLTIVQMVRMHHAKTRSQKLPSGFSRLGNRGQNTGATVCCFSQPLAGVWFGSGAGGIRTAMLLACQYHRQRHPLCLLHQVTSMLTAIPTCLKLDNNVGEDAPGIRTHYCPLSLMSYSPELAFVPWREINVV